MMTNSCRDSAACPKIWLSLWAVLIVAGFAVMQYQARRLQESADVLARDVRWQETMLNLSLATVQWQQDAGVDDLAKSMANVDWTNPPSELAVQLEQLHQSAQRVSKSGVRIPSDKRETQSSALLGQIANLQSRLHSQSLISGSTHQRRILETRYLQLAVMAVLLGSVFIGERQFVGHLLFAESSKELASPERSPASSSAATAAATLCE